MGYFKLQQDGFFAGLVPIGGVVEEGQGAVEVFLHERIIRVAVALHAAHRRALEDLPRGPDAVDDLGQAVLLVVRAALLVGHRVAIEGGGYQLLGGRIRQQVPGQLFDREPVERHVGIERLDKPVAVTPDGTCPVGLVTL